jgi:hypothetical protein
MKTEVKQLNDHHYGLLSALYVPGSRWTGEPSLTSVRFSSHHLDLAEYLEVNM